MVNDIGIWIYPFNDQHWKEWISSRCDSSKMGLSDAIHAFYDSIALLRKKCSDNMIRIGRPGYVTLPSVSFFKDICGIKCVNNSRNIHQFKAKIKGVIGEIGKEVCAKLTTLLHVGTFTQHNFLSLNRSCLWFQYILFLEISMIFGWVIAFLKCSLLLEHYTS